MKSHLRCSQRTSRGKSWTGLGVRIQKKKRKKRHLHYGGGRPDLAVSFLKLKHLEQQSICLHLRLLWRAASQGLRWGWSSGQVSFGSWRRMADLNICSWCCRWGGGRNRAAQTCEPSSLSIVCVWIEITDLETQPGLYRPTAAGMGCIDYRTVGWWWNMLSPH